MIGFEATVSRTIPSYSLRMRDIFYSLIPALSVLKTFNKFILKLYCPVITTIGVGHYKSSISGVMKGPVGSAVTILKT